MTRDDDIDNQVDADQEFTRRAEQLLTKLRNQGMAGGPSPGDERQKDGDTPKDGTPKHGDTPKHE
jgi:hypothetical protein